MDGGFVAPSFADWQDRAAALDLKREGREIVGPCPHCGGTNRFAVKPIDGGAALVNCRQCRDFGAILAAIGWDGRQTPPRAPHHLPPRRSSPAPRAWARWRFPYIDADGREIVAVMRRDFLDSSGAFAKRCHRDPEGARPPASGWPLYRLPSLAANPGRPVLVVEGEKAAEAANCLFGGWRGFEPTCPLGGANEPHCTDWRPVAGRRVVVWPDADGPGVRFARAVAKHCREAGADTVLMVDPAGLPVGWDLGDEIPPGLDIDRPVAGPWPMPRDMAPEPPLNLVDPDEMARPSLGADGTDELFRTMGEFLDMDLTPPEFLIDGILPVGGVAIVGAKPERGEIDTHADNGDGRGDGRFMARTELQAGLGRALPIRGNRLLRPRSSGADGRRPRHPDLSVLRPLPG